MGMFDFSRDGPVSRISNFIIISPTQAIFKYYRIIHVHVVLKYSLFFLHNFYTTHNTQHNHQIKNLFNRVKYIYKHHQFIQSNFTARNYYFLVNYSAL